MLNNTRHSSRKRNSLLAVPAAVAAAALLASPLATAARVQTNAAGTAQSVSTGAVPAPTPPGFIMRDGGICDPIRHMGC